MHTYRERLFFAKSAEDELNDRIKDRLSREGIDCPTSLDFERAQVEEMQADPELAAKYHSSGSTIDLMREMEQRYDDEVDDLITRRAYKVVREQGISFKKAVEAVMRENADLQRHHSERFKR